MNVSIPEAFALSLLGMAVVFVVLIFLMYIINLMSVIIKASVRRKEKKTAGSGTGGELK